MPKLQVVLLLMAPFALIAFYHHFTYAATRPHSLAGRPHAARHFRVGSWARKLHPDESSQPSHEAHANEPEAVLSTHGVGSHRVAAAAADEADAKRTGAVVDEKREDTYAGEGTVAKPDGHPEDQAMREAALKEEVPLPANGNGDGGSAANSKSGAGAPLAGVSAVAPGPVEEDVAASYPAPTLSPKRLLDTSENYLPVPDAESEDPSDLRWRKAIPAACKPPADAANAPINSPAPVRPSGCVCPAGRRPYHTILTAQASTYQRWQTLIFYHHFKKQQRLNPCTEMVGFTRLLASSNGSPDDLMDFMPTVTVGQLGFDKTRGFQVINRPWTMLEFLKKPEWTERIVEQYVYIAETDHLLLQDIPNRATPSLNVAFFFPYMSPVPTEQANVVKRYYDGNHLSVQPVGPSPAIVHVDQLKKLTPLWYDLSVELKHDGTADRAFGWVLEMWGYSIACARVGVKHFVWQQLQIEPSSTWHQNVSAEQPYIYHYTFGVEYSADGIPMVGTVGEWSLDKRHYFGAPPPRELAAPPKCAQECAWTWWGMFNEATRALGDKYPKQTGGNLRSFKPSAGEQTSSSSPLAKALLRVGPWVIDGKKQPVHFHAHGRVSGKLGQGKWSVTGELTVQLELCGSWTLTFDTSREPTTFKIESGSRSFLRGSSTSLGRSGAVDQLYSSSRSPKWQPGDEGHVGVARLLGSGPWAWAGISTMAFYDHGVLVTPWGHGSYYPDREKPDVVVLEFAGASHRVTTFECHKFTSVRESDGNQVDGWIQLGGGRPGEHCSGGGMW